MYDRVTETASVDERTPKPVEGTEPRTSDGIGGAVFLALLVTMMLLVVERIAGGGWRSLWSVLATWMLLVAGVLPLVLLRDTNYPNVVGRAATYGAVCGFLYGLVCNAWFSSTLFGACVGHTTGYLLHRGGWGVNKPEVHHESRLAGLVAMAMLAAHMTGVIRPTSINVAARSAEEMPVEAQQQSVAVAPAGADDQIKQADVRPAATRVDEREVVAENRPFSAKQCKAIRESRGLQIVESFGELSESEVDTYMRMKEQFAKDGETFSGTTSENAVLLMMLPARQWKKLAQQKGLSRQEYFFATNFVFSLMIEGYNLTDRQMHGQKLVELTGERLTDYE